MSQPLTVHLEAMSRYATAMDDLAEGLSSTHTKLVDAGVTEDSFGMLPESRETAGDYEQRTEAGLTALRDGERVFGELGVAFRQMRDNYEGADQVSADPFGG